MFFIAMSTPTPNPETRRPGEGLVVVRDGVRVSGASHATSESAAEEAAAQKRRLNERDGDPSTVGVKQQING